MHYLRTLGRTSIAAGLALAALVAQADTVDVNLAGWQSFGEWAGPGSENSETFISVPAGSTITGFEYLGLSFSTENGSWLRELTLSVASNDDPESLFLDWRPSTTSDEGTFGPESGSWGGSVGNPGLFGAGESFVSESGMLWISVYESFDDPIGSDEPWTIPDAMIGNGTLPVHFTSAVPEPSTYGLMALGLAGVVVAARRRARR